MLTNLEIKKYIDVLKPIMREKLVEMGLYMHQTMGFPVEYYIDLINDSGMSMLEQLSFINSFSENHKSIKPIYFKDLKI